MERSRFEKLTVGLLVEHKGGMFKPGGLGVFYDPTKKAKATELKSTYSEYDEEAIYGKYARCGRYKYPNVEPLTVASIYSNTLRLAGIDADEPVDMQLWLDLEGNRGYLVQFPPEDLEKGCLVFQFLSMLYFNHHNVLTSLTYLDKAKADHQEQATVITLGPNVRTFHAERFHPIYIGGIQQIDSLILDKSVIALEFYSVEKRQLTQIMDRIGSKCYNFSISLEDLPAHQVAHTHSLIWDSNDLPRGYRANFIKRGMDAFEDRDIGKLMAYSLFPPEMEAKLIESLELLQKTIIDPIGILQKCEAVNELIKQAVKDEFYADFV
jgi:hypothetical protein